MFKPAQTSNSRDASDLASENLRDLGRAVFWRHGHGGQCVHKKIFESVKNAKQVLFHSTLEPNTEVFSKVSCGVLRSTKFRLNFAKQRRNDMQPS